MLKLHGFSSSNYYNVVKLTLLEKNIEFEEVLVYSGAGEKYRPDYLEKSPQGKIPTLETAEGCLTESRCIVRYLEEVFPEPPLFPAAPFARAKLEELTHVIDLYFELAARRVLRNLFTRKKPPETIANEVRETLTRTTKTLQHLARFDAYLFGDRFSAADVSAVIHFPVVQLLSTSVRFRSAFSHPGRKGLPCPHGGAPRRATRASRPRRGLSEVHRAHATPFRQLRPAAPGSTPPRCRRAR